MGRWLPVEEVDFMPYGEEIGFGSGSIQAGVVVTSVASRFTGKERDADAVG